MRHQMGSDLKSSGLPPEEVAAVMGHQSTASASVYGFKVSGRGSVAVKPTGATVAKVRKVCPISSERFTKIAKTTHKPDSGLAKPMRFR
jgi:hypothetical protein